MADARADDVFEPDMRAAACSELGKIYRYWIYLIFVYYPHVEYLMPDQNKQIIVGNSGAVCLAKFQVFRFSHFQGSYKGN